MAAVLLLGLDDSSAETIAKLSIQAGHSPRREPMRTTFQTNIEEDLVFVSGDQSSYREAIGAIRRQRVAPPVIVISRLGENSGWLDALEAGAADVCAAPYTLSKIKTIIEGAAARPKAFAA